MRKTEGYRLLSRNHGPYDMGYYIMGNEMIVSEGPLRAHVIGPDIPDSTDTSEADEKGDKARNEQEHTNSPFVQFA